MMGLDFWDANDFHAACHYCSLLWWRAWEGREVHNNVLYAMCVHTKGQYHLTFGQYQKAAASFSRLLSLCTNFSEGPRCISICSITFLFQLGKPFDSKRYRLITKFTEYWGCWSLPTYWLLTDHWAYWLLGRLYCERVIIIFVST